MANQPAVLTVKKTIDRPSLSDYEKFIGLPIGNIIDAQGRIGAVDYKIKPITTAHKFTGPVLTVDAGPRDNLAAWMALDYVRPGDVLMIATGGYSQSSVIGDLFVGMARNAGVVGIVTDGVVRDQEGLVTMHRRHDRVRRGGFLAGQHLVELGHRRIGVIAGPGGLGTSARRLEGFNAALTQWGHVRTPRTRACRQT